MEDGEKSEKGNLTRASHVPCRCGRAFYYRMHLNTKRRARGSRRVPTRAATSMEFRRMFLREAARSPVHTHPEEMHFVHTYTFFRPPSSTVRLAPSLHFSAFSSFLFLRATPRRSSIHILFFLFLQVSITRTCIYQPAGKRDDQAALSLPACADSKVPGHESRRPRRKASLGTIFVTVSRD